METVNVFVYGTLKIGGIFSWQMDEYRTGSQTGYIHAGLYLINGEYPGVNLSEGDRVVAGELHTYRNPQTALAIIDRIEGFSGEGHRENIYNRAKTDVYLNDGSVVRAYVYEYAGSFDGQTRINSWE